MVREKLKEHVVRMEKSGNYGKTEMKNEMKIEERTSWKIRKLRFRASCQPLSMEGTPPQTTTYQMVAWVVQISMPGCACQLQSSTSQHPPLFLSWQQMVALHLLSRGHRLEQDCLGGSVSAWNVVSGYAMSLCPKHDISAQRDRCTEN